MSPAPRRGPRLATRGQLATGQRATASQLTQLHQANDSAGTRATKQRLRAIADKVPDPEVPLQKTPAAGRRS